MKKRILADMLLVCLFLFAPWYFTATAAIIFILLFENYWEGAALALIVDSFYSLPEISLWRGFGFLTLSSLIILYVSSFAKRKIKVL